MKITRTVLSLLALSGAAGAAPPTAPMGQELANPGMEEAAGELPAGWMGKGNGYRFTLPDDAPHAGKRSALIASDAQAPPTPRDFGNLMQTLDAAPYRGKRVRFAVWVKLESAGQGSAHPWLRVDRPSGTGFFDNMAGRPVLDSDWARYEIVAPVDADATAVNFGAFLVGMGKAWVDDASLETLGASGEGNEPPRALLPREEENLAALARLVGYVRYFHPSDAAAKARWDELVVDAVRRVEGAKDPADLAARLTALLEPLAPTVRVVPAERRAGFATSDPAPAGATHHLAWWHLGVGITPQSLYASQRVPDVPPSSGEEGEVVQSLESAPLRGKRITFRAWMKTAELPAGSRGAFLVVRSGKQGQAPSVVDTKAAGFTAATWTEQQLSVDVAPDADWIGLGFGLHGAGKLLVDDARVEVAGGGAVRAFDNGGFETPDPAGGAAGWQQGGMDPRYVFRAAQEGARTGDRGALLAGGLAPGLPAPDEALLVELPGGVVARVPLALPADAEGTLPRSGGAPAAAGAGAPAPRPDGWSPSGDDRATRLGDVILAWNVFQHFYPYFDVAGTDWPAALVPALREAAVAPDAGAFARTLRRLVAKLRDGHGGVMKEPQQARLPLAWETIEDALVVTHVAPGVAGVARGDVVLRIDGIAAADAIRRLEDEVSGATPQWIRSRVLDGSLMFGPAGSKVALEVAHADGASATVELERKVLPDLGEPRPDEIAEIADGIAYVDLSRIDDADFEAALPELVKARGIVVDLRGYPKGSTILLSHLTDRPVACAQWWVPIVTRPDREGMTFDYSDWSVGPEAPRLTAKVAFLTDGRAISYAETYLGIVEHHHLAAIVGSPTAGTNGNVNPFTLPGGYTVTWTGMKVLKQDGSRHHGVGILPTVPATRTLAGVRAGRDEVLEKGIAAVR